METMLVRMKPYDPRRGFVLRRFTFGGIRFQEERGWYLVEKPVADYLRTVREVAVDPHSPAAFDVCTEAEARALEVSEGDASKLRHSAMDDLKLVPARLPGTVTAGDLPKAAAEDKDNRRTKRGE